MNLLGPLWLSAQLALVTTIILVIVGAPLAAGFESVDSGSG